LAALAAARLTERKEAIYPVCRYFTAQDAVNVFVRDPAGSAPARKRPGGLAPLGTLCGQG